MSRQLAQQLASEFIEQGNGTDWFELLYAEAGQSYSIIPWADLVPNPNLVEWVFQQKLVGNAKKALVIGCGYGDDAEFLADSGFQVTAFDISPTAIAECQQRFPSTQVSYHVTDLFNPPSSWTKNFDFVLEAYTLQVLPSELRRNAVSAITSFASSSGQVLIITRGREDSDSLDKIPYPLTKLELKQFEKFGLTIHTFEDYFDNESPPVRRFRALYKVLQV